MPVGGHPDIPECVSLEELAMFEDDVHLSNPTWNIEDDVSDFRYTMGVNGPVLRKCSMADAKIANNNQYPLFIGGFD